MQQKKLNIDYEIRRQKTLEKELGYEFIRINPAKEDFNIFIETGGIQNDIAMSMKSSTKKTLIDEFSEKLSRLKFKTNSTITTKCLRRVVEKYCLRYKNGAKTLLIKL